MAVDAKDFDKFYTHPEIAKRFVDTINKYTSLDRFDLVIEPSAGSGLSLIHI